MGAPSRTAVDADAASLGAMLGAAAWARAGTAGQRPQSRSMSGASGLSFFGFVGTVEITWRAIVAGNEAIKRNQTQSNSIKRNQAQSNAIKCNLDLSRSPGGRRGRRRGGRRRRACLQLNRGIHTGMWTLWKGLWMGEWKGAVTAGGAVEGGCGRAQWRRLRLALQALAFVN